MERFSLEVNVAMPLTSNGQWKLSSWKSGLVLTRALIRSMFPSSTVILTVWDLTSALKKDPVNGPVVWYSTISIVLFESSAMGNG